MIKCKRCDYEWDPVEENPVECPRCKSYKWNIPLDPRFMKIKKVEDEK